MVKCKQVFYSDINPEWSYLVLDEYNVDDYDTLVLMKGGDITKRVCDVYDYESWKTENDEGSTVADFLCWYAEEMDRESDVRLKVYGVPG